MDLSFTPDERAFRAEMRDFFRNKIPAEIRDKAGKGEHVSKADLVTTQRAMNAAGIAVPHWPVAYGGKDWTSVQSYIWLDEMQTASVPAPLAFNTSMVGPVIAQFGSEAQKQRFLPATANLDIWWCQGFSEPGAGSDLAGLRTTARREGDEWVVNGQKTWTTLAQYADWIFCLCRTDPNAAKKQEGISFILIDMKTPGITVRPIQTLDGGHEVNEVWFDDVRVPAENLVGQENKGWDYAKFLLGNERTGIARVGVSKARLLRLRELAKLERMGDKPMIEDRTSREADRGRDRAARARDDAAARGGQRARPCQGQAEPGELDPEDQGVRDPAGDDGAADGAGRAVRHAVHAGEEAEGDNDPMSIGPDYAAEAAPTYFNWRKVSIYGGSNEIQRNIVAKAILGF